MYRSVTELRPMTLVKFKDKTGIEKHCFSIQHHLQACTSYSKKRNARFVKNKLQYNLSFFVE